MAREGEAIGFEEEVSERTRAGETLAFGLRTAGGIAVQAAAPWEGELIEMRALGLLEARDGRLRLTRRGKLLADSVAEAFV
jgi:oxygen-independent coproporphyrinogen-3 oxidase